MHPALRMEEGTLPLTPKEAEAPSASWHAITKVAFRFAFVYLGLYNSDLALHLLPVPPFSWLEPLYQSLRWNVVVWVSRHVLHLAHDFNRDFHNLARGSKDTTYVWVQILCYLAVAVVVTVAWSLAGSKRREYACLHAWFLVYLRVCLAAGLISFGAVKLLRIQFPPPQPSELVSTVGSFRRDLLMWLSMGVSPIYSFFGGMMEVVPALLLLTPRLVTLGALLSIATVTNILMLNFGYDIGAKSLTINMLLMSIVIVLPDAARLTDFFLLNRRAPAARPHPLFRQAWLNRVAAISVFAFGVVLLSYNLYRCQLEVSQREASQHTPLYGTWFVDDYSINGQSRPPLSTNAHRWQRMIVNSSGEVVVQVMTGDFQPLLFRTDPQTHRVILTEPGNAEWIAELTYDDCHPGSLTLQGTMGRLPILIRLHREDSSRLPLNNDTIHWVKDSTE